KPNLRRYLNVSRLSYPSSRLVLFSLSAESMQELDLGKGQTAKVDDDDYERLHTLTWYAAKSRGRRFPATVVWIGDKAHKEFLHRKVLGLPREERQTVVEHVNGDTFDCRKENLHVKTPQARAAVEKYKGVVHDPNTAEYSAVVTVGP